MPIYITKGCYTAAAVQGMIAKPEDRSDELNRLLNAVGGKLLGLYYTFGEHDFLAIGEAPGEKELATALLAAAAGGSVTNLTTTVAISAAEMKQSFANAAPVVAKFRSAGK